IGARRASVAARCAKVVARSTIVHAGAPIANAAREVVTVRPWSVAVDRAFVVADVPNGAVDSPNGSGDRGLHAVDRSRVTADLWSHRLARTNNSVVFARRSLGRQGALAGGATHIVSCRDAAVAMLRVAARRSAAHLDSSLS